MALAGFVYAPVGSATFYHTDAVHPGWAARVTSVGTIGAHIFYRLPGVWGGAPAYRQRYGGVEPGVAPGTRFAAKVTEALVVAVVGCLLTDQTSVVWGLHWLERVDPCGRRDIIKN